MISLLVLFSIACLLGSYPEMSTHGKWYYLTKKLLLKFLSAWAKLRQQPAKLLYYIVPLLETTASLFHKKVSIEIRNDERMALIEYKPLVEFGNL